jgi:hypothetical protein
MGLWLNMRIVAAGQWSAATPPVLTGGSRGFTVVRNGVGDYTATLDEAVDATECVIFVQVGTSLLIARVVHTSDTAKQVLVVTAAAGAATDSIVDFMVIRTAP